MKRHLSLSILFCIASFVYAQDGEGCIGDSIVEVKNGVIYYPKISKEQTPSQSSIMKMIIIDNKGKPLRKVSLAEVSFEKIKSLVVGVRDSVEYPFMKTEKRLQTDNKGRIVFEINKKDSTHIDIRHPDYQKVLFALDYQSIGEDYNVVVQLIKQKEKEIIIAKPAIYLYPTSPTKVNIKHTFMGTVLNTYPDYGNGWEVIADPSGKLLNIADNRNYSHLFWDGAYRFSDSHYNYRDGFYVKKGNYASFLLDKLTLIGLNETEINDFIVYWLPSMNSYDEVFVHFWINDDIDNSSKLDITPKPDTMIRVFMEFGEYKGETKLPEQVLTPNKRIGFTLLEWGGSEIVTEEIR